MSDKIFRIYTIGQSEAIETYTEEAAAETCERMCQTYKKSSIITDKMSGKTLSGFEFDADFNAPVGYWF